MGGFLKRDQCLVVRALEQDSRDLFQAMLLTRCATQNKPPWHGHATASLEGQMRTIVLICLLGVPDEAVSAKSFEILGNGIDNSARPAGRRGTRAEGVKRGLVWAREGLGRGLAGGPGRQRQNRGRRSAGRGGWSE